MNTAFRIMIFDGQNSSSGFLSAFHKGLSIYWLNAEEIDNSDIDSFSSELVACDKCFIESNSGGNDGKGVFVGLLDDFGFTNLEHFIIVIDDLKI